MNTTRVIATLALLLTLAVPVSAANPTGIRGHIELAGPVLPGFMVTVTACGYPSQAVRVHTSGWFTVYLAPGPYDVIVKGQNTLAVYHRVRVPARGLAFSEFGYLPPGDANSDNRADFDDHIILLQTYLTNDGRCDWNYDGIVNRADADLLTAHYDQWGEECWPQE